jgi:hypothetical protein
MIGSLIFIAVGVGLWLLGEKATKRFPQKIATWAAMPGFAITAIGVVMFFWSIFWLLGLAVAAGGLWAVSKFLLS